MAKTEDIEAKLAAYVDGELDAAGRAEIEQHLTANPQHRALIADLSRQRDALRGLPRAKAPPEVAEAFNAQLERSVLLGDGDVGAEADSMRINRWPQIRAAAAVLALTLGLAAAILYVLPSPSKAPKEIADIRVMPVPGVAPLSTTEEAQQNRERDESESAASKAVEHAEQLSDQERRARSALANGGQLAEPSGLAGGAGSNGPVATNAAPPSPLVESAADAMKRKLQSETSALRQQMPPESAGNDQLVYVIPTDDPVETDRKVRALLERNQVALAASSADKELTFQPATLPTTLAVETAPQSEPNTSAKANLLYSANERSSGGAASRSYSLRITRQQAADVRTQLDAIASAGQRRVESGMPGVSLMPADRNGEEAQATELQKFPPASMPTEGVVNQEMHGAVVALAATQPATTAPAPLPIGSVAGVGETTFRDSPPLAMGAALPVQPSATTREGDGFILSSPTTQPAAAGAAPDAERA